MERLRQAWSEHYLDKAIAAIIFLGSLAYLLIFRRYTAIDPDEGILLQGAERILQGQTLYRDFFSFFTPGSYYLLALIFTVFGDSFLVARTGLVILGATFPVSSYLIARSVCSRTVALSVAVAVALTTLPYRFLVLHNWDSTVLACLTLYCALKLIERANWQWGFTVGSLASSTFLFEQSKGAGLIAGLGIGLVALTALRIRETIPWRSLLVGISWPLLMTVVFFAAHHALHSMLADWMWPLWHYTAANHVP